MAQSQYRFIIRTFHNYEKTVKAVESHTVGKNSLNKSTKRMERRCISDRRDGKRIACRLESVEDIWMGVFGKRQSDQPGPELGPQVAAPR